MTVSSDIDLSVLLADTEAEILRVVGDRDASTVGVYEMIRYHLGLDGDDGAARQADAPPPRAPRLHVDRRRAPRALPGAAAVELGHNFSLVHDDIEDGDIERRHRPTLWAIHGVPQAINTGDLIFSLSRVALHRLTDLGFSDTKVLRLMRLYDETCVLLCEGQYLDIATSASDEPMSVELLLRHDRPQDGGPHLGLHRGGRPARDRRRRGHRALPAVRLGARASRSSSTTTCWASGAQEEATGKVPTDLARHKKTLPVLYALQHAAPVDRRRLRDLYADAATRTRRTSPRSSTSSTAPAPRSTPAARRAAIATRRWASSTP